MCRQSHLLRGARVEINAVRIVEMGKTDRTSYEVRELKSHMCRLLFRQLHRTSYEVRGLKQLLKNSSVQDRTSYEVRGLKSQSAAYQDCAASHLLRGARIEIPAGVRHRESS